MISLPVLMLPFILAALLSIDAISNMVNLWIINDTYMHGAFVLPIVALMAYNKAKPAMKPNGLGVVQTFFVSAIWATLMLLGHLSMINVIQQLAVIAIIPVLVLITLGWKICWYYRAPLTLLFFSIPAGEFLIPHLQSLTAELSVVMLRLAGIPVLLNGWYISIPAADFRVAEACSGVGFLLSTFAVSVFYSFIYMNSHAKRWAFIALGIAIPLAANAIRVFLVILLADIGYVEEATGDAHIFYGSVLFFIVLVIVFIIGYYMQDPAVEKSTAQTLTIKELLSAPFNASLFVLVGVQVTVGFALSSIPLANDPHPKHQPIEDVLGPSFPYADTQCYAQTGDIKQYVFTYNSEGNRKKLISWDNRWFNADIWSVSSQAVTTLADGAPATVLNLVDLNGRKMNLYYHYLVNGQSVTGKLKVKGAQIASKLFRTDFGGQAHGWFASPEVNPMTIKYNASACSN